MCIYMTSVNEGPGLYHGGPFGICCIMKAHTGMTVCTTNTKGPGLYYGGPLGVSGIIKAHARVTVCIYD